MTANRRYSPATVPQSPGLLPRYLDRELRKVGASITALEDKLPVRVLLGESTVQQAPAGIGDANRIQISFGPAQGDATTPVQLLADGSILFNQAGIYSIDTRYMFQRSGSQQNAVLFIRGVFDGVQVGNPIAVVLNESTYTTYEQYTIAGLIPQGVTLAWQLARDPAGVNDGFLATIASGIGWGSTPSALVRILKF